MILKRKFNEKRSESNHDCEWLSSKFQAKYCIDGEKKIYIEWCCTVKFTLALFLITLNRKWLLPHEKKKIIYEHTK